MVVGYLTIIGPKAQDESASEGAGKRGELRGAIAATGATKSAGR